MVQSTKYESHHATARDPGSSLQKIFNLIPAESKVLDVGCSSGYLAEGLIKEKQCRVTGIEFNSKDAQKAEAFCEKVICCDVERDIWEQQVDEHSFDVVVFADVLEHLHDPVGVLRRTKSILKDKGYIVISVPNISHVSARLKLLMGEFPVEKYGLFDSTHLHFYTRSTLIDMVSEAGFYVEQIEPTYKILPDSTVNKILQLSGLTYSPLVKKWFEQTDGFAYQFIVKASLSPGKNTTKSFSFKNAKEEIDLLNYQMDKIYRSFPWRILVFFYWLKQKIFRS